jgi:hypothetical protein
MKGMRVLMAVAVASGLLAGCGEKVADQVAFGKAPAARQMAFAEAVVAAMKTFEDLDSPKIVMAAAEREGRPVVTVRGEGVSLEEIGRSLSVVVTNFALKYPGVGYQAVDESTWQVLLPDDISIPVEGEFGLGFE